MWEIRIDLNQKNPEQVTVTALYIADDSFSYSEVTLIQDFKINSFVQKALAKRAKWTADQVRVREIAKTLSADIMNALNKADGIEKMQLSVTADKSNISCVKYERVELVKEV